MAEAIPAALPFSALTPELALLLPFVALPYALALIPSIGARGGAFRHAAKAYALWIALLALGWIWVTGGKLGDAVHGFLLYAMFFSVVGAPVVALLMRVVGGISRLWKGLKNGARRQPA